MRSHTTACGQDSFGYVHSPQVFGRSFLAYQNHFFASVFPFFGFVGEEYDTPAGSTRRSRQTFGNNVSFFQSFFIEYRMEQLVQFSRFLTQQSCFFIDHTLFQHIDSHFHHSGSGTFSVTGLQHPQLTVLDGEFHILHIVEVVFQFFLYSVQIGISLRHSFFQRRIFRSTFFFGNTLQFSPTA